MRDNSIERQYAERRKEWVRSATAAAAAATAAKEKKDDKIHTNINRMNEWAFLCGSDRFHEERRRRRKSAKHEPKSINETSDKITSRRSAWLYGLVGSYLAHFRSSPPPPTDTESVLRLFCLFVCLFLFIHFYRNGFSHIFTEPSACTRSAFCKRNF